MKKKKKKKNKKKQKQKKMPRGTSAPSTPLPSFCLGSHPSYDVCMRPSHAPPPLAHSHKQKNAEGGKKRRRVGTSSERVASRFVSWSEGRKATPAQGTGSRTHNLATTTSRPFHTVYFPTRRRSRVTLYVPYFPTNIHNVPGPDSRIGTRMVLAHVVRNRVREGGRE